MPNPSQKPGKTYRKFAVRAGVYHQTWIDPDTEEVHRETVYISPEYLRQSAWSTMQMMRRGLEVPVCLDHQDGAFPKKTGQWLSDEMRTAVGLLRSVRYDPQREEHEYEYEVKDPTIADKCDQGIITKVSPNFHKEFSPGDGSICKNVIGHLALTFRPKDYHQDREPMATVDTGRAGQNRFSVLSMDRDSIVRLVPMHKMDFSTLVSLGRKVHNGFEFRSADYKFNFPDRGAFMRWLGKRYRQTLKMSVSGKMGHVLYFAVIHAPVGGVIVNSKKYLGGQFIPNAHVEALPPAERDKVRAASAASMKKRAETAGKYVGAEETQRSAIARHVGEHAKAEMSPEDKKAAMRRWASLRGYHGDAALQQVAALAGKEAEQLAKLDPNSPKAQHIKRRLRAYHEMAQVAKAPEAMPMKASETGEKVAIKANKTKAADLRSNKSESIRNAGGKVEKPPEIGSDLQNAIDQDSAEKAIADAKKTAFPLADPHTDAVKEMAEASSDADQAHEARIAADRKQRIMDSLGDDVEHLTDEEKKELESDIAGLKKDDQDAEDAIADKHSGNAYSNRMAAERAERDESLKRRNAEAEAAQKKMLSDNGLIMSNGKTAIDLDNISNGKAEMFLQNMRVAADNMERDAKTEQSKTKQRSMRNDVRKARKEIADHEKRIENYRKINAAAGSEEGAAKQSWDESRAADKKIADRASADALSEHEKKLETGWNAGAAHVESEFKKHISSGLKPAEAYQASLKSLEKQFPRGLKRGEKIFDDSKPKEDRFHPQENAMAYNSGVSKLNDLIHEIKAETAQLSDKNLSSRDKMNSEIRSIQRDDESWMDAEKRWKSGDRASADANSAKPAIPVNRQKSKYADELDRLDKEIRHNGSTGVSMGPAGTGKLSWGGADFDYNLKAKVGKAFHQAISEGKSVKDAHQAALDAGKKAVKYWNDVESKGRVSAGGSYQLKQWEGAGDSYADDVMRRFAKVDREHESTSVDPFSVEEDKEGNIRGVLNVPKEKHQDIYGHYPPSDQIKGKWREKAFRDQDGDDKLHARLRNDVMTAHSQHLNRSSGTAGSADLAKGMASYISDRRNALASYMNPAPKDRPEVAAEYGEASGFTRKYKIKPVSASTDSGVGYQAFYERHDPDTGKVIDTNNYGPIHESYDHAAMEIGMHMHGLSRNGHGDKPIMHDHAVKAVYDESKKSLEDAEKTRAEKEESERSGAAAKYRLDREAINAIREDMKKTKRTKHTAEVEIGATGQKVKVTGVKHGNFLVHRPAALQAKGMTGSGFVVTHIPTGRAAHRVESQQTGLEIAHLLGQHGDWSKDKLDKSTLEHGYKVIQAHNSGEYSTALDLIEKAKKSTASFSVVHAPAGGADAEGKHYLGGQFTPNKAHATGNVTKKAESPKAEEKKSFYRKADSHAKNLKLEPKVNTQHGRGYQHGNMFIHKKNDQWQITHLPTGKRIGKSTYKDDAIRKAYILHHGLDWNFAGEADKVHEARFKDVAKGTVPRDLKEGQLEPGGGIPGSHADMGKRAESWMKYRPNYENAKKQYIATHGSFDENGNLKSIVADIDNWRPLIPGYNGLNAPDTHSAAKHANEQFIDEMLKEMKGKGNGKVAILGGGSGSGKGTAVGQHFDEREYPIRIDQTSRDYPSLMERINKLREHGMEPDLVYVDRKPLDAWQGVVGRAGQLLEKGEAPRVVPKHVAIESNIEARKVAHKIATEHPDIPLRVIDNHEGYQSSRLLKNRDEIINHLSKQEYNINDVLKEADNHVQELEKQGKLPAHVAKVFRGT